MTAGNVSAVSDAAIAMTNVRTGQGYVSPVAGSGESFQSLMSATTGKQLESNISQSDSSADSSNFDANQSIQNSQSSADKINKADNSETVSQDDVDKAYEDVKDVVEEQLGLTDEELDEKLSELGLTVADLLMPQNVALLVAEVNETDVTAIVTDESLAKELNTLTEEITRVVESFIEGTETTVEDFADELAKIETPTVEDNAVSEDKQNVLTSADGQTAATIVKDESTDSEIKVTVEKIQTDSSQELVETPENASGSYQEDDGVGSEHREDGGGRHEFAENIVHNLTQAVNESIASVAEFTESYTVNTSDVINQMLDAIKVNVTSETTSMEIQLTPENLGRINLNVASKDGVITATITAQNETVKAVIENQIVQLKESLNNQGLKVEQVEVTIASREFSMNHENSDDSGSRQSRQGTRKRFRTDDELSGIDKTIDELLEQQIMETNGISVNYTA